MGEDSTRGCDVVRLPWGWWWGVEIRAELSWLGSYLDLLESHLRTLPSAPPEALRAELDDPDEDVRHPARQMWDHLSEAVAPSLSRGAFVIALYAAYESAVREIARQVARRLPETPLDLDDIRARDFLTQAKLYYSRVLGIPVCPSDGDWAAIHDLAHVRHLFAHSNGHLAHVTRRGRRTFMALEQRGDATEAWQVAVLDPRYPRRALAVVTRSLGDLLDRTKPPESCDGSGRARPADASPPPEAT